MAVTRISEYRSSDTVTALEELLVLAKQGTLTGMVFACKYDHWHHGVGVTGDYRRDPIPALGVAGRLFRMLNRFADSGI